MDLAKDLPLHQCMVDSVGSHDGVGSRPFCSAAPHDAILHHLRAADPAELLGEPVQQGSGPGALGLGWGHGIA